MEHVLKQFINKKYIKFLTLIILYLSGFGVSIGRFLRYNSWEIIKNPLNLFSDIFNILLKPSLNLEAWLFTILFGSSLSVGYWMFKQLSKKGG